MTYTVLGPAGAPMRPPWGSFAGKPYTPPSKTGLFTVLGPAGAPMQPPYASFAGKPTQPTTVEYFTVSGVSVHDLFPVPGVVYSWAAVVKRTN